MPSLVEQKEADKGCFRVIGASEQLAEGWYLGMHQNFRMKI